MFFWNEGSHTLFWVNTFLSLTVFSIIAYLFMLGPDHASSVLVMDMTAVMMIYWVVAALFMPRGIRESSFLMTLWKNTIAGLLVICFLFMTTLPRYVLPPETWSYSIVVPLHPINFMIPDDKELNLLTRVVYGEARGESPEDQQNIVHSIINRSADKKRRYGGTIRDILLKPNAYSCLNPDDPNYPILLSLPKDSKEYKRIYELVRKTYSDRMNGKPDPTMGATHYHTGDVNPKWNTAASKMIKLGSHKFWIGVDDGTK
jgi:hypothetical protein